MSGQRYLILTVAGVVVISCVGAWFAATTLGVFVMGIQAGFFAAFGLLEALGVFDEWRRRHGDADAR